MKITAGELRGEQAILDVDGESAAGTGALSRAHDPRGGRVAFRRAGAGGTALALTASPCAAPASMKKSGTGFGSSVRWSTTTW